MRFGRWYSHVGRNDPIRLTGIYHHRIRHWAEV